MSTVQLRGITCQVAECRTCGIPYTVPLTVYETHREKGGFHFCPNGHQWGWSEDRCEEAIVRQERDRLRQEAARKDEKIRLLQEQRGHAERQTAAVKGHLTRHKKRAAAGTCPCCNRTFQQLARHMKNQHPKYVDEQRPALKVVK